MTSDRRGSLAVVVLVAGFALFVLAMASLIGASVARGSHDVATFTPTPPSRTRPARPGPSIDTVTIDASDEAAWRFFSFARGTILTPPDTAGWDIAVRRFHIIASSAGAIADAGRAPFDRVTRPPTTGFVPNTARSDTVNDAIGHWYRYGMLTHLLTPNGHIFVVRSANGRYTKLEPLGYYCPGLKAGCVTVRYGALGGR